MTRAEHLQWAKDRALQELNMNGVDDAFASMLSDVGKHPETFSHPAKELMSSMYFGGMLNTPSEMRKFIEGFN